MKHSINHVLTSSCTDLNSGTPQDAILGPLFFLIHINDLSLNVKLFADDTSLFSVFHDIHISANDLNKDLKPVTEFDFQWKVNLYLI